MKKMKPQECKTGKINYRISCDTEKLVGNRIKIFRIAFHKPESYEIEVYKMKDKKC